MKVLLLTVIFVYQAAAGPIPDNDNTNDCLKICESIWAADFAPNKDTIFTLYTRNNSNFAQTITYENMTSIEASNFNKDHPTRFIIHGYRSHGEAEVNKLIRSAYIQKGEFNIITVDWKKGAGLTAYLCPKSRAEEVGTIVGMLILWLKENSLISLNKTSVIGHSLGAHAAGFAGKYVDRNNNNQKLHTIIALDPASPCFDVNLSSKRVTSTDAQYVEVIHTCSILGIHVPIGSTDFYPNWGYNQPRNDSDSYLCHSHSKAYYYFADSINDPKKYNSTKCASYQEIVNKKCTPQNNKNLTMGGEPSNHGSSGIYYCNKYVSSIITTLYRYFLVVFIIKYLYYRF